MNDFERISKTIYPGLTKEHFEAVRAVFVKNQNYLELKALSDFF